MGRLSSASNRRAVPPFSAQGFRASSISAGNAAARRHRNASRRTSAAVNGIGGQLMATTPFPLVPRRQLHRRQYAPQAPRPPAHPHPLVRVRQDSLEAVSVHRRQPYRQVLGRDSVQPRPGHLDDCAFVCRCPDLLGPVRRNRVRVSTVSRIVRVRVPGRSASCFDSTSCAGVSAIRPRVVVVGQAPGCRRQHAPRAVERGEGDDVRGFREVKEDPAGVIDGVEGALFGGGQLREAQAAASRRAAPTARIGGSRQPSHRSPFSGLQHVGVSGGQRPPDCRRHCDEVGGARARLAGGRFRAKPREHGPGGRVPVVGTQAAGEVAITGRYQTHRTQKRSAPSGKPTSCSMTRPRPTPVLAPRRNWPERCRERQSRSSRRRPSGPRSGPKRGGQGDRPHARRHRGSAGAPGRHGSAPRRPALPGARARRVAAGGPHILQAAAPRHPHAQPDRVLHRRDCHRPQGAAAPPRPGLRADRRPAAAAGAVDRVVTELSGHRGSRRMLRTG